MVMVVQKRSCAGTITSPCEVRRVSARSFIAFTAGDSVGFKLLSSLGQLHMQDLTSVTPAYVGRLVQSKSTFLPR